MGRRWKMLLAAVACIAVVATVGHLRGWFVGRPGIAAAKVDYLADPLYSTYEFGQSDNVIDVGVQPVWIPTNIITEVIKRDMVLKDELAQKGLEIRFHGFRKGADVNFFLDRGDLQVGVGGDMPALTAAAKSDVLVASIIQKGFCSIVARRQMLTTDLKGMRIAYGYGSISHYRLLHLLLSVGLDESDVDLVAMDVGMMPEALKQGEIDAFAAWEPAPAIALITCEDARVIHRSLSSGYLYFSRSFAQQRPDAMRLIIAAQIRALKWLKNRDRLLMACRWAITGEQSLTGRTSPLSERAYMTLAKKDLLGLTLFPAITAEELGPSKSLRDEFRFLKRMGSIPANSQWDDIAKCFDTGIVEELAQNRRKHRLDDFQYAEKTTVAGENN